MAENAAVYFLTATATADDMKVKSWKNIFMQQCKIQVACEILAVQDDLQMNICVYRGMKLDRDL